MARRGCRSFTITRSCVGRIVGNFPRRSLTIMNRSLPVALVLACSINLGIAQEPPPSPEPPQPAPAANGPERPGFTPPSQEPRPYEKVITKDAQSAKGIFTVHQVKDKYYYEIPYREFEEQFL